METANKVLTQEQMFDWISDVLDPELGFPLTALGLVYTAKHDAVKKEAHIEMTLTSPACPAGEMIVSGVRDKLQEHPDIEKAYVAIVWEPKWNPVELANDEVKDKMGLW